MQLQCYWFFDINVDMKAAWEKGDIKENNDANKGNVNHCLFAAHYHS